MLLKLSWSALTFSLLFAISTQGDGIAPSFLQDWYQNLHV